MTHLQLHVCKYDICHILFTPGAEHRDGSNICYIAIIAIIAIKPWCQHVFTMQLTRTVAMRDDQRTGVALLHDCTVLSWFTTPMAWSCMSCTIYRTMLTLACFVFWNSRTSRHVNSTCLCRYGPQPCLVLLQMHTYVLQRCQTCMLRICCVMHQMLHSQHPENMIAAFLRLQQTFIYFRFMADKWLLLSQSLLHKFDRWSLFKPDGFAGSACWKLVEILSSCIFQIELHRLMLPCLYQQYAACTSYCHTQRMHASRLDGHVTVTVYMLPAARSYHLHALPWYAVRSTQAWESLKWIMPAIDTKHLLTYYYTASNSYRQSASCLVPSDIGLGSSLRCCLMTSANAFRLFSIKSGCCISQTTGQNMQLTFLTMWGNAHVNCNIISPTKSFGTAFRLQNRLLSNAAQTLVSPKACRVCIALQHSHTTAACPNKQL